MSKNAVIYARISEDRAHLEEGIGRQLEDCRRYAERCGFNVVAEVVDNDVSAYSRRPREGWAKVLEMAQNGETDVVLAWQFDRLYRRPIELEQVIERIYEVKLGIELVNGMSMDLGSAAGQFMARQLVSAANLEVRLKSERATRKFRQMAEQGKPKGGGRPIGFEADGETHRPIEAKALRQAAKMVLAGATLTEAAKVVQKAILAGRQPEDKIRYKRSNGQLVLDDYDQPVEAPFSASALKHILLSPRIIGMREYISTEERHAYRARQKRGEVSGSIKPKIVGKATWKRIITAQTQKELEAVLISRAATKPGRRPQKSLLAGILFCGHCGHKLLYSPSSYSCVPPTDGGCRGTTSGGVAVNVRAIEDHVTQVVDYELSRLKNQEVVGDATEPEFTPASEWEAIEHRRLEIQELWRVGVMTLDEARIEGVELDRRKAALNQRDSLLLAEHLRRKAVLGTIADWTNLEVRQRSEVIAALIKHIVILPARRRGGPGLDTERVKTCFAGGECACEVQGPPDHAVLRVLYPGKYVSAEPMWKYGDGQGMGRGPAAKKNYGRRRPNPLYNGNQPRRWEPKPGA